MRNVIIAFLLILLNFSCNTGNETSTEGKENKDSINIYKPEELWKATISDAHFFEVKDNYVFLTIGRDSVKILDKKGHVLWNKFFSYSSINIHPYDVLDTVFFYHGLEELQLISLKDGNELLSIGLELLDDYNYTRGKIRLNGDSLILPTFNRLGNKVQVIIFDAINNKVKERFIHAIENDDFYHFLGDQTHVIGNYIATFYHIKDSLDEDFIKVKVLSFITGEEVWSSEPLQQSSLDVLKLIKPQDSLFVIGFFGMESNMKERPVVSFSLEDDGGINASVYKSPESPLILPITRNFYLEKIEDQNVITYKAIDPEKDSLLWQYTPENVGDIGKTVVAEEEGLVYFALGDWGVSAGSELIHVVDGNGKLLYYLDTGALNGIIRQIKVVNDTLYVLTNKELRAFDLKAREF